jgi:hypothetical protein
MGNAARGLDTLASEECSLTGITRRASMELVPDIDRLTQIFSNAVAPSFFLGAIAAFVSLMMSRLGAVNARIKETRESPSENRVATKNSVALGSLARRSRLLNDGIILSLGGGVCATLLLAARAAWKRDGLVKWTVPRHGLCQPHGQLRSRPPWRSTKS